MAAVALSAAFMVGGYEFVRVAAASIFIETHGAARMPLAMTAVPFLMVAFIYLYARLLSAAGPLKSVLVSLAASAAFFTASYFIFATGIPKIAAAALYVFTEVYVVILVEQYWSFINSTLDIAKARLYNGPIAGGGALGPIAADWAIKTWGAALGTEKLLLLTSVSLLPAGLLIWTAYRLAGEPRPGPGEAEAKKGYVKLGLLRENKALLLLMGVIFLSQMVATALNLKLYQLLEIAIPGKDARSVYLGGFWMYANGGAALLQFVLTPALLRFAPFMAVMLLIPAVHLMNATTLAISPTLLVAAVALGAFKSMDYSIFRAAKELIYIPLSYDVRYRAKQVVDSFTYRFSKGTTALALSAWQSAAGSAPPYAALAACAAGAWLALSVPLARAAEGKTQ
jgi:AAA family ATP:ADP antiporter